MKKYEWVLFDADETLFTFDAFRGLQRMFLSYGVDFSREDYLLYQSVNQGLWVDYQNGLISSRQLMEHRFDLWSDRLQVEAAELNAGFMSAMADICEPMVGAVSLLNMLKGRSKLGIITNGFSELQQIRLAKTGLTDHFEFVVISEEVGVAKPHPAIFEHSLSIMGYPPRENILMVGDNPASDVLGGLNAGFQTCWLNVDGKQLPPDIKPHHQVSSLSQLESRLSEYLITG